MIDGLLGIFLLAVIYEFSNSAQLAISNIVSVIFYVSLFFVLAPVAANLLTPLIKYLHRNTDIPGLIPVALV